MTRISPSHNTLHSQHPNEYFRPKFGTGSLWAIYSIPLLHFYFSIFLAMHLNVCIHQDQSLEFDLGLLEAVGTLMIFTEGSSISISWTHPFTLDISRVDPDITGYCINIISTTSLLNLNSQCGINVTEFHYTLPPDSACHIYNFTIVPVNIVGNGTADTRMYSQADEGIVCMECSGGSRSRGGAPNVCAPQTILAAQCQSLLTLLPGS